MQAFQSGPDREYQYTDQTSKQKAAQPKGKMQELALGEFTDRDKLLVLNRINEALTKFDARGQEKYFTQTEVQTTLASCRVTKWTQSAVKTRIEEVAKSLAPPSSSPPSGTSKGSYRAQDDSAMAAIKAFEASVFDPKLSRLTASQWEKLVSADGDLRDFSRASDLPITDRDSALKLHKVYREFLRDVVDGKTYNSHPLIGVTNEGFTDFHIKLEDLKQSPGALFLFLSCLPTREKNPELSSEQIANIYRSVDGSMALYAAEIPFEDAEEASKEALETAIKATGNNINAKREELKTKLDSKIKSDLTESDVPVQRNFDLVQALYVVDQYSKEGGLSNDPSKLSNQLIALTSITQKFTKNSERNIGIESYSDSLSYYLYDKSSYEKKLAEYNLAVESKKRRIPEKPEPPEAPEIDQEHLAKLVKSIKKEITEAHPALAAFVELETL